jgi:hypothetical protein
MLSSWLSLCAVYIDVLCSQLDQNLIASFRRTAQFQVAAAEQLKLDSIAEASISEV